MRFCLITFRSVTPAQRAESLLRRSGLGCTIQRTPRWMEEQGCGYSLRVKQKDAASCVAQLRRNQIPFRKVYVYAEDGSVEDMEV